MAPLNLCTPFLVLGEQRCVISFIAITQALLERDDCYNVTIDKLRLM